MTEHFLTADTHFSHGNIIRHCKRPFATIEEHDETIIQNINALPKNCVLHHLGDVTMRRDPREYIKRIRRDIILEVELGNHDNPQYLTQLKREGLIKEVRPSYTLQVGKDKIFLAHFLHFSWNCSHYGAYHAHGHSHGAIKIVRGRAMDVGVDCHEFKPIHVSDFILNLRDRTNNNFYDTVGNQYKLMDI